MWNIQGENTKIRQINDAHFRSAGSQAKTGGHDKAVKFSVGLIFFLRSARRKKDKIVTFFVFLCFHLAPRKVKGENTKLRKKVVILQDCRVFV
jgi:hypothetical protein